MKTTPPEPATSRTARAVLTYLAEPADVLLGGLLQAADPPEIVAAIQSGALPGGISQQLSPGQQARIGLALAQWRMRLAAIPAGTGLGCLEAQGVHLLCPGDPGWPGQLDDLGQARPYALWVRGTTDLRDLCGQSAAVVGSRAATAYGTHMCAEITTGLAADGWAIVSGGAYGIDATAHRSVSGGFRGSGGRRRSAAQAPRTRRCDTSEWRQATRAPAYPDPQRAIGVTGESQVAVKCFFQLRVSA
jgi:DNA processing protein